MLIDKKNIYIKNIKLLGILLVSCCMMPYYGYSMTGPQPAQQSSRALQFAQWAFGAVGEAAQGVGNAANSLINERARAARTLGELEAERGELEEQLTAGTITRQQYNNRIRYIAGRESEARLAEQALGGVMNAYQTAFNASVEITKAQALADAQQRVETAKMAAKTDAEQRGALQRLQHLTNPQTLKNIGLASIGVCSAVVASYYASKFAYNYLMTKIGVPTLIRETSMKSYQESLYEMVLGETLMDDRLCVTSQDLVLNPYLDEQVKAIACDLRSNHETGLPHKNLLLYGPPGTGKTTIAKILAREAGMDYAIMSGADFAQFSEGKDVEQLHNLFDFAASASRGLVIFIDEIDAFARDRSVATQRAVNLLNAFLSRTGELATKFMIVGATNHKNALDAAFLSRMHKRLEIPLPGAEERQQLIKTYLNKYITQDRRTIHVGDDEREVSLSLAQTLTDDFINNVGQELYTGGFTGRDIAFMVDEMRAACYRQKSYELTPELFVKILHDKRVQVQNISIDDVSTSKLLEK